MRGSKRDAKSRSQLWASVTFEMGVVVFEVCQLVVLLKRAPAEAESQDYIEGVCYDSPGPQSDLDLVGCVKETENFETPSMFSCILQHK